jgi:hypothetical protein
MANGKWQMANAKCPTPNAKCQMPNAKCQMPNAKCQMPNGKCSKVVNVTVFSKINVHFILFSFFDSYKKLPPNNFNFE